MKKRQRNWTRAIFMTLGLALVVGIGHTAPATAPQCFEVDNGSGTVTLPPANCEYMTAADVHKIIAGLPAGTEIILAPIHRNFICRTSGGSCGSAGGTLGGQKEVFSSDIVFQVTGTGTLSGWSRTLTIPLNVETHTAPRTPGAPVQSFKTDMYRIQGGITGDPDFASLQIVGGTGNGYPSPGHTTLTLQPDGKTYAVDSSFNITVAIDFVGAGKLGNYRGRTVRKVTMKAFGTGERTEATR